MLFAGGCRCLFHAGGKGGHLDGGDGGFVAFVAIFPAGPVECLLLVAGGEYAEYYGNVEGGVEPGGAFGNALAHIIEVGCLALYDATQYDDGVGPVMGGGALGSEGEFVGAGHMFYEDVLGFYAVFL